MDEERKKEIMKKLPDEHKKTISKWCEDFDLDKREIFSKFCEIHDREVAEKLDDDVRMGWALTSLDSHLADTLGRPTDKIEIYVVGKDNAIGKDNLPSKIYGLGSIEDVDGVKFVTVNGWEEEKKMSGRIEVGKGYDITASRQTISKDKYTYNFEAHSTIKGNDYKLDKPIRMLKPFFPLLRINDAEHNTSRENDYNDFKMVKGHIQRISLKTNENGRTICVMVVRDESVPLQDVQEGRPPFTVISGGEMAKYGKDSECVFLGTIRYNEGDEYGASMWASGIIPIIPIPLERNPEDVEEREVQTSDAEKISVPEDEVVDKEDSFDDYLPIG